MAQSHVELIITAKNQAGNAINSLGSDIKNLGNRFNFTSADIRNAGLVLAGFAATVGTVAKGAINIASDIEQASIAFTTMTGSAEVAHKLMKDISDFAVKTPFELPGVIAASKQLLAMGASVDDVLPELKMLGDLAAGTGAPLERLVLNFGQVRLQGKLTGRELRDFAVNGVGLLEQLAVQMGKTTEEISEMVSEGEIGFEDVRKAFESMTGEGGKFANLMEAQSKSFAGVMSNVRDEIIRTAATIVGISTSGEIREGSLFAALKTGAEGLLVALNKLRPHLEAFANWVAGNKIALAALGGVLVGLFIAPLVILAVVMGKALLIAIAITAGLGLLAAQIAVVYLQFKKSVQIVKDVWIPAFKSARDALFGWADDVRGKIDEFVGNMKQKFEDFKTGVTTSWNEANANLRTSWEETKTSLLEKGEEIQLGLQTLMETLQGHLNTGFENLRAWGQLSASEWGTILGFWTGSFLSWIDTQNQNFNKWKEDTSFAIQDWGIRTQISILEWAVATNELIRLWGEQASTDINNFATASGQFILMWADNANKDVREFVSASGQLIDMWVKNGVQNFTLFVTSSIQLFGLWKRQVGEQVRALQEILTHFIEEKMNQWKTAIPEIWTTIASVWNSILFTIQNKINDVRKAIEDLIQKAREFKEGFVGGFNLGIGNIFSKQAGGMVPGPVNQPVPIMAHGGEQVKPAVVAQGTSGGGGGVVLNVSVGLYAGTETEKRNIARDLYEALARVAESQNKTVAEMIGR